MGPAKFGNCLVTKYLTQRQLEEELSEAESYLLKRPELRQQFAVGALWTVGFRSDQAGVYAIFDGEELLYVGETGSLKGRMRDLRRTLNHSFRRALGTELFSGREGYICASSKRAYSSEWELELDSHMRDHISVVAKPIAFGRKEIEEFLIDKYRPRFCVKGRRGC